MVQILGRDIDCVSFWGHPLEYSFTYYVYFHFAEIEKLPLGQKRVIDITVNDDNILTKPITLEYLKPQTVYTVTNQSCIRFSITATSESAAPPILNAYEMYQLISPLTFPTDQSDGNLLYSLFNSFVSVCASLSFSLLTTYLLFFYNSGCYLGHQEHIQNLQVGLAR